MRNESEKAIDGFGRDLLNESNEFVPDWEAEYSPDLIWGIRKDEQSKNLTAKARKAKKNLRLMYPLSMAHKLRPDYNNQELGTTKAANRRFDEPTVRGRTKERKIITRELYSCPAHFKTGVRRVVL
jgi:hypothetical protein